MTQKKRILSIDYGDSRTGLALSDPSGLLAQGIGCLHEKGMRTVARQVAQLAKEREAGKIVVGLPINMDGSEGFRAEKVRTFAALLGQETDLPIVFYDERLSTMQAHRIMNYTETFGKKRKENVDTLSAQIILQDYLDANRGKGEPL